MPKLIRLSLLIASLATLLGAMSSAATAVTWDNSGATTFTATAGSTTFSATSISLSCPSNTMTGTAPASVVGLTYTISGSWTYNSCSFSGISTAISCGYAFTGTAQDGSGAGAGTTGTLDLACDMTQSGATLCRFVGTWPGRYTNGGTTGVLSLNTGGAIKATNGTSGTCFFGNGDLMHFSATTLVVNSANAPFITRTA
jgi:hypothetical protein